MVKIKLSYFCFTFHLIFKENAALWLQSWIQISAPFFWAVCRRANSITFFNCRTEMIIAFTLYGCFQN